MSTPQTPVPHSSEHIRAVVHPAANRVEYYPPAADEPGRAVTYEQTFGRRMDAYTVGLGLWVLKNAITEPGEYTTAELMGAMRQRGSGRFTTSNRLTSFLTVYGATIPPEVVMLVDRKDERRGNTPRRVIMGNYAVWLVCNQPDINLIAMRGPTPPDQLMATSSISNTRSEFDGMFGDGDAVP